MSDAELLKAAADARERAYAPYSGFKVGAALLLKTGRLIAGANVENISYGLTICAERVAVFMAVQSGCTEFALLALVSDSFNPIVPCGACRQVLAEFHPDLRILCGNLRGHTAEFSLSELLPAAHQGMLGSSRQEHV